jgi:hypothetical protein
MAKLSDYTCRYAVGNGYKLPPFDHVRNKNLIDQLFNRIVTESILINWKCLGVYLRI